jgi:PAS domain S-box-containing protein
MAGDDEDELLRSAALKNANSILLARQRAEEELIQAKEALEQRTAQLARSLSMLHATLEATTDGILVTNETGCITDFNEQYVRMWGLPRRLIDAREHAVVVEFIGQKFADPERFLERTQEIGVEAPAESYDLLELADGRVFERFSRSLFVAGQKVGRVWSCRDVTERRHAEDALRDEGRLLELLNNTSAHLVSKLEIDEVVQAVTDAATQLSGAEFGAFFYNTLDENQEALVLYALSGAPREAFESLGHPRATPLFGPTFRGEGAVRCDDFLNDPRYDGWPPLYGMPHKRLPVRSYLAAPVVSRSGDVIGGLFFGHSQPGVFTERTERLVIGVAAQAAIAIDNARLYEVAQRAADERKQLLESERAARATAERASAMKDEFLATLSHELRTPLSAILGWAQVLRRQVDGQQELQQAVDTIERNARAQTQLIADLLDMSRITSGKLRLDIQAVEPMAFIESALEAVLPASEAKHIRVEKHLGRGVGQISGDPARLQQVMWNLLSNAIKFTGKGGSVRIQLERVSAYIEIAVTDTGIGIRSEYLPHIFDRFRQADASTTRTHGGLGIGLAIVKQLVELHGGTVQASSPGARCGSTFTVRLPVVLESKDKAADSVTSARFDRPDLTGIRVLVVDDEADARELVKRILTECHADVLTASGATDALAHFEQDPPNVLVSDIGMPDVDGYELLKRVRALGPPKGRVPAIALTAFARPEDRTRTLLAGFLVHIAKPIEPTELAATIATVVGRAG